MEDEEGKEEGVVWEEGEGESEWFGVVRIVFVCLFVCRVLDDEEPFEIRRVLRHSGTYLVKTTGLVGFMRANEGSRKCT